jgi:phosphatidylglycerophosphatase C
VSTLADEDTAESVAVRDTALPRVVLFDFDGVLIHGDSFYLFMRDRYRRSPLRKLLALLAMPWLLLRLPFSRWLPVRSLVHIALLGTGQQGYARAARSFAADLARRPRQFCRDGLQALRRHQAAGDRVVVVTGCEHVLVSAVLAELGLAGLEIVASQLRPGWFGMRIRLHNVGHRKPQEVAAYGIKTWQLAYGDSVHDIAMLKAADEAVLVNGTPKLCKKVERALGRAVTRVQWY